MALAVNIRQSNGRMAIIQRVDEGCLEAEPPSAIQIDTAD
jgi:hypothetical protein